ncbi:MAG TPA: c-type cytochrome [Mariprofundaceae bacterium]|nr:c-type cytochrome [Mariprofundaceae bacterium]
MKTFKHAGILATFAVVAFGGFAGNAMAAGAEKQCLACHNIEKGAPAKVGPNLFGVIGRKAGQMAGFKYSDGLKNSGITWTEENLRKWMNDAPAMVKGTRMPKLKMAGANADEIIAFLKSKR